jgi:Exopolysaccharide biosynthesis protein YbjH/Capsule biosynthesis GfcC
MSGITVAAENNNGVTGITPAVEKQNVSGRFNLIKGSYALSIVAQTAQPMGEWLANAVNTHAANSASSNPSDDLFTFGLVWQTGREMPAQVQLKQGLLSQLQSLQAQTSTANAQYLQVLARTIGSMPITGRAYLPTQDGRLMQVQLQMQPVLQVGDMVSIPKRPRTVSVLLPHGVVCRVLHRPNATAAQYIQACTPSVPGDGSSADVSVDTAYVVQVDGQIESQGLAAWNATPHNAPSPGAWIWAPSREAGIPVKLSEQIASFLATQGSLSLTNADVMTLPPLQMDNTVSESRGLPQSSSDWGVVGLLQTPTARLRKAGAAGVSVSRTAPYTHTNLTLQPFDALEIGLRYTNISTSLYGPEIAGDRAYLDKSADIKLRILEESRYLPQIAIGLRDPAGTGFFAGEYLVSNKRFDNFDFSLGLGWGYLGGRGNISNPLGALGERFKQRETNTVGQGGTVSLKTLFSGKTALFGGVQWHTPLEPLALKLELDGNNYRNDRAGLPIEQKSSFNVGAVWKQGPLDLTFGLERGKQWTLGLSLNSNLDSTQPMRISSVAPVAIQPMKGVSAKNAVPTSGAASIAKHQTTLTNFSAQSAWFATQLQELGDAWLIDLDDARGFYLNERLDKGIAVLHRDAPANITRFVVRYNNRQTPVTEHTVYRSQWVKEKTSLLTASEQIKAIVPTAAAPVQTATSAPSVQHADVLAQRKPASTGASLGLGYEQRLGGPDGYLYALYAKGSAKADLWQGGWIDGAVQLRLIDNYDKFKYTADSALPRVRTNVREYVTSSRLTIPNLTINQMAAVTDSIYALGYAGLLEPMYAGIGGEILYRPDQSRLALGVDINQVRQRDFKQNFALRPYQTKTGHVTLYWDTKWNDVFATLSAGQYLAGDRGATIDLSRQFANGLHMGVWATKTNVSSAQFGEGSFDKGVYISLPFDAFFSSGSGSSASFAWHPLLRDGGAKLGRKQLWDITQLRDPRALDYKPN